MNRLSHFVILLFSISLINTNKSEIEEPTCDGLFLATYAGFTGASNYKPFENSTVRKQCHYLNKTCCSEKQFTTVLKNIEEAHEVVNSAVTVTRESVNLFSKFKEIIADSLKDKNLEEMSDCLGDNIEEIRQYYEGFQHNPGKLLLKRIESFQDAFERFYDGAECLICNPKFTHVSVDMDKNPIAYLNFIGFNTIHRFFSGIYELFKFKLELKEFARLVSPLSCMNFKNKDKLITRQYWIEENLKGEEKFGRCKDLSEEEFKQDEQCLDSIKTAWFFMMLDGFKDTHSILEGFQEALKAQITTLDDGSNLDKQFEDIKERSKNPKHNVWLYGGIALLLVAVGGVFILI